MDVHGKINAPKYFIEGSDVTNKILNAPDGSSGILDGIASLTLAGCQDKAILVNTSEDGFVLGVVSGGGGSSTNQINDNQTSSLTTWSSSKIDTITNSIGQALIGYKSLNITTFSNYIDFEVDFSLYENYMITANLFANSDNVRCDLRVLDLTDTPITTSIYNWVGRSEDSASNSWVEYSTSNSFLALSSNSGYLVRSDSNGGYLKTSLSLSRYASKDVKISSIYNYKDTNNRLMSGRIDSDIRYVGTIKKFRLYFSSGTIKGNILIYALKNIVPDKTKYNTMKVLPVMSTLSTLSLVTRKSLPTFY